MWRMLAAVLAMSAMPALGTTQPRAVTTAPAERWEDLAEPVRQAGILSRAIGRNTAGQEILYLGFSDSAEAFVLALDPRTGTGKQLGLGCKGGAWGLCAHSNGKAYASGGALFELDAAAGRARRLGPPPGGEKVVWELWEASDGHVYGGTYPGAKLVRINTRSGALEDLGSMDPGQKYVRTVAVQGDYVYCGCGVTKSSVWAYHIPTGRKTQLLPDEARRGTGWGRAFARPDGHVYIYADGARELVYRVDGLKLQKVGKLPRAPHYQLADGSRLHLPGHSGPTGTYLLDPAGGKRRQVQFACRPSGTPIFSLVGGPDGRVYGTTWTPITLFAFDPKTSATQVYGDPVRHPGQVYSHLWHGGRLHMAAYAYSTYTVWDPKRPWKWGLRPDSNPRRVGSTSEHVLRANAMLVAPDGRHMIVGGAPHYGMTGGGICIVDPDKATFDVVERPVGPQSPWQLATTPDPAVIVIGTTWFGGTGSDHVDSPARLVFWDWKRRRTVGELTPWPDEKMMAGLLRVGNELFITVHGSACDRA